jgi:uncharacterized phage protein (TIGR01671 family)
MRELKFRVWDGLKMNYPKVISFDMERVSFAPENLGGGMIAVPIKNCMEYTGLKDMNGKEIYEGDFIQNVADNGKRLSIFEIRWQQACCGFVKEREDGNTFTLDISKYFEVIGNIYENPELI